jgi:serine protease Do
LNRAGRVIGVDTAIYSSEGNTGSIGVGFAIPANVVRVVVRYLRDPEHVRPEWLGLRVQEVTPDVADAVGLKRMTGALVTEVDARSSAANAGIREGDLVLKYGQRDVNDSRELLRLVAVSSTGQTVPLVIWRHQREVTLSATVGQAPTDVSMPITPRRQPSAAT